MKITALQQPTENTCGPTCLAMILGVPVSDVLAKFQTMDAAYDVREMQAALTHCRVPWNSFTLPHLVVFGTYILTVPSLNVPGSLHYIVVESSEAGLEIYDPQAGRPDKKFYGDGGLKLNCWSEPIFVVTGSKFARLPESIVSLF